MFGNDEQLDIIVRMRDEASAKVRELNTRLRELNATSGNVAGSQARAAKSMDLVSFAAGNLRYTAIGAGLAVAALGLNMLKLSGQAEQTRVGFATLLGGVEEANALIKELQQFAASTPFESTGVNDLARSFLAAGYEAERIIPIITSVGDAASAMGKGQEGAESITRALNQMANKGKVSAEEMQQLAEVGINGYALLAKQTGISEEKLRDHANTVLDGKVAVDLLLASFDQEFGGAMEDQSETLIGLWSTLRDEIGMAARAIGDEFLPAAKEFVRYATAVLGGVTSLIAKAKEVRAAAAESEIGGPLLSAAGKAIKENIPYLGGAAKAFGFLKDSTNLYSKATGASTVATKEATAAAEAQASAEADVAKTTALSAEKQQANARALMSSASSSKSAEAAAAKLAREIEKLADANDDLSESYNDVIQEATDSLASLRERHSDFQRDSDVKIGKAKNNLRDLKNAYKEAREEAQKQFNQEESADRASVADQIVAQEKKIADLRKGAAGETDATKRSAIERELAIEQEAYTKASEFIQGLTREVEEARRVAALTEFERQIEEFNAKRERAIAEFEANRLDAEKEYNAKVKEQKREIARLQEEADEESEIFKKKELEILAIYYTAQVQRMTQMQAAHDLTIQLIDKEIDKYKQLAEAIKRAAAGKPEQVKKSYDVGGVIPGLPGMPVPIIAHGGERIIPASDTRGSGNGGGVTIINNFPGMTVSNREDQRWFTDMLDQTLRDVKRDYRTR